MQLFQPGVLGRFRDGVPLGVQGVGLTQQARHVDLVVAGVAIGPLAVNQGRRPEAVPFA
ncbi:hypothetical protein D3C71_1986840 [compost metagenome]